MYNISLPLSLSLSLDLPRSPLEQDVVALLELFAQLTEELSKGKDCGEREVQEACEKCVEKIKVSVQATRTRFLPLSPSFSSRRQSDRAPRAKSGPLTPASIGVRPRRSEWGSSR